MERTVNPAMLILARESRGLNQKELAKEIGVTQGKISKYENGIAQVSEEDLRSIARVLRYTEELFFLREDVHGLGTSFLFHRQRQRVPVRIQKRIEASINVLVRQVQRLLRSADLDPPLSFDVLSQSETEGKPERAAELVRAAWRVPTGPIQNITALIEGAGGIVLRCDFDTPLIDAAHLWLPGTPPLFFVNSCLPGDRLRWTLAHELGHAFLHRHYVGEDIEDDADRFAGEFLIPKREAAAHLWDLTLERAAALKPYWKISMASLVRQAHRHKCITAWKYKSLNISISKQGYRRVEPFPIAIEEPTLLKRIVNMYRNEFHYDGFEFTRLLFTDDSQFFSASDSPRLMRVADRPFFAFPTSA